MTLQPPRRRWFQFRLRTLLIAIAVLAVPCAWVGYQLNWIRARTAFREAWHSTVYFVKGQGPPRQLHYFGEVGIGYIVYQGDSQFDVEGARKLYPEAVVLPNTVNLSVRGDL